MEEPEVEPYVLEEDLIAAVAVDGLPRVRVYALEAPALVLGRGSRLGVEARAEAAAALGVPLLRRRGGGCAVVIDPGNLIVAATLRVPGFGDNLAHFARLCRWVTEGLARAGMPGVGQEGTSDLVLGDRKVGGSCIYRGRGLLHFSTTVLLEPDLDLVERLLPHPPREPAYRQGRRHRDFMGRIAALPSAPPLDEAPALLGEALGPLPDLGGERAGA